MLKSQDLVKARVHFCGIGGVGMSAIARLMIYRGCRKIQGSNNVINDNVRCLAASGIDVFIGHSHENVRGVDVIVHSTAIADDNLELQYARDHGICIMHRADMLAIMMQDYKNLVVAGSHGKTTTTSLAAHVLRAIDVDPTMLVGGIVNDSKTNSLCGDGDWMVIESDESDGSFTKLPHNIAVITNIDSEHLPHYQDDLHHLIDHFVHFANNTASSGVVIVNTDCKNCRNLLLPRIIHDRVITYGIDPVSNIGSIGHVGLCENANVAYHDSGCSLDIKCDLQYHTGHYKNTNINLYGKHNVHNAMAVLAAATEVVHSTLGNCSAFCDMMHNVVNSMSCFSGVERRFTVIGTAGGAIVVDDYAHHPTEIAATLCSVQQFLGSSMRKAARVIVVFQPHRYSRIRSLYREFAECFVGADVLYVSEVYAASEIYDADSDVNDIATAVAASSSSHVEIFSIPKVSDIVSILRDDITGGKIVAGDLILFLGAGDISSHAKDFVKAQNSLLAAQSDCKL